MKIYHPSVSVGSMGIAYRTNNQATELDQIRVPINDEEWKQLHGLILDADDGFQHERKRKYILQDFANIIQGITNHFTASIWKTIKACPLLTIHEVLWLKVDDIDSRVDHIEKTLLQFNQLIEYTHLLQLRMDVIEKSQANNELTKRWCIKLIEENKLLQCRMQSLEKLVVQLDTPKELLYELD
jgi:hypothetical protein